MGETAKKVSAGMDIFAENICEFCRENRKTLCELHRNGGLLDKIRPDILLILSISCGQNATRHGAFVKVAKIIVEIGDVFMYNVYIAVRSLHPGLKWRIAPP